jgi:LacI family transcriptional regulator
MNRRVTIKDIALKAGVSVGTVDRVIHNRGRVSPGVQEKIQQVMQEMDFEPNLIASTLAFNRTLRIGALMPHLSIDPYWDLPLLGMRRAQQAVKHYGVVLQEQTFDLFDPKHFKAQALELVQQRIDALVFPPIFHDEALEILDACAGAAIPSVLINTDVEHPQVLSYIGQDSYQSGVLAGKLLSYALQEGGKILLFNLDKEPRNAKHLLDKGRGLADFYSQHPIPGVAILSYDVEDFDNKKGLERLLNTIAQQYSDIKAVFVSNSRAYKLIEAWGVKKYPTWSTLGFDLLPKNLHLLQIGKIDFLINQNANYQGYSAIKSLTDHFIFKKPLPRVQHLPLDIVVAENASYYERRELAT